MQRLRTWRLAVTLVAVLALVATACGGDDDDGAAEDDDAAITTTTVAKPTGKPIVVFSSMNIVGGQSSFGPRAYGFVAGIEAQNARGGIQGRPLEAPFCDGHSNPNDEAACLQQGLDAGTVIIANSIFRQGDVTRAKLDAAGLMELNTITPAFYSQPRDEYVPVAPGQPATFATLLIMKELGAKTYQAVTASRITAQPESEAAIAARTKLGLTRLESLTVDPTTTDWAPTAQAIKEANADVLVGVPGGLGAANDLKLLQAMQAIGHKPFLVGAGAPLFTEADTALAAPAMNGKYYRASGALPADYTKNAEIKRMHEELAAAQRGGTPHLEPPYNENHFTGWLTAQAVIALLKEVKGDITAKTVHEAAKAAKNIDLGGVTGDWTPFVDEDPVTRGRQVSSDFYVVTMKNGKYTLVDSKLRCGKLDGCKK